MAIQKFKTFYAKIIKEREDFETIREGKYKKGKDVEDLLDEIIDKFTADIYESINQLGDKMVTLDQISEEIMKISNSEVLSEAVEYGKGCVELFEDFQSQRKKNKGKTEEKKEVNEDEEKEEKEEKKSVKKSNISEECGLLFPVSRFKTIVKSKSAHPKLKATIPVFFAGFFETIVIKLLLEGFNSLKDKKTLGKANMIKIISDEDGDFNFLINYV